MALSWFWSARNRCYVAYDDRFTLKVYKTMLDRALYLVTSSGKVVSAGELLSVDDAKATAEQLVVSMSEPSWNRESP